MRERRRARTPSGSKSRSESSSKAPALGSGTETGERMPRPVKPTRKRDGRLGPPQGYPKDPDRYADPANWKYPVHTPFHARAARRYFNEPRNRAKYTPEEQAYVDKKINEALERFGVAVKIKGGQIEDEAGTIQADVPMNKDIDKMTFAELLPVFLGTNRLASAKAIDPSLVSVDKETDTLLAGRANDYLGRDHLEEEPDGRAGVGL